MQAKYTTEQALKKLAEIVSQEKSLNKKLADTYKNIDWDNIDTTYSDDDDLESAPYGGADPEEIKAQMIEYVHLYVALNDTAPDATSTIEYLSLIAKQDYPNNPYGYILAYAKTIQARDNVNCPRKILFSLGMGADVDYTVAKLA